MQHICKFNLLTQIILPAHFLSNATQWLSCKTATTQPDLSGRRMDYVF